MGISAVERVVRLALAVALAVAGVAMVSHHAATDAHGMIGHEHPALSALDAHGHHADPVGEDHPATEPAGEHDHELLLMGCAALVVALLASLRFAPPATAPVSVPPVGAAPAVTISSGVALAPPRLEQLCVLRR